MSPTAAAVAEGTDVTLLMRLPPAPPGGASLAEAFENVALAMFNYMTVRFAQQPSAALPALLFAD